MNIKSKLATVLSIAWAEIRHFFHSPIAWVGTIILLIFFATDYRHTLSLYVQMQDRGGMSLLSLNNLSHLITVGCPFTAVFMRLIVIHSKFILPLILMGSISREYASGTIRLIQSSPVAMRTFVWGKFLGQVGYCLLIVLVLSLFVITFSVSIVSPEMGILAWQLICTLLYFMFLASICLFASALSSYAIVGGAVSIVMIILLNLLSTVGQATALGDFFYPLSHQALEMRLQSGGIDWNDFIVLVLFTFLFVKLTVVYLKTKAQHLSIPQKAIRYGGWVTGVLLAIALLPYRPIGFSDIRREHSASLHPNMANLLAQMDKGPLEVIHYFNIIFLPDLRTSYYTPTAKPMIKYNTWRSYMHHKKDINVTFKYYYAADTADYGIRLMMNAYPDKSVAEVAQIMANTYGYDFDEVMTLEEAQREVDIQGNEYIGHLMKLQYNGRQSLVLGPGMETMPSHDFFYPALERLVSGRDKELFFVQDGKARNLFAKLDLSRGYIPMESMFTTNKQANIVNPSWKQIGPLQDSIRLEQQDVPEGAKAMVLTGPRAPLSNTALAKIKQFIDEGGNLLLASEPEFKVFMQPLLDYLGVSVKEAVVVQPTPQFGSSRVLGYIAEEAYPFLWNMDSLRSTYRFQRIPIDTVDIAVDGVSALDVSAVRDFAVKPLVYSREGVSWNVPVMHRYDSLSLLLDQKSSDEQGSFPLMVLLHRELNGKKQYIVVSGDTDFIKRLRIPGDENGGRSYSLNRKFSNDVLSLLTNNEYPVNLESPRLPDNRFTITLKGVAVQEALFVYGLPGLILCAGAFHLIRRRRK